MPTVSAAMHTETRSGAQRRAFRAARGWLRGGRSKPPPILTASPPSRLAPSFHSSWICAVGDSGLSSYTCTWTSRTMHAPCAMHPAHAPCRMHRLGRCVCVCVMCVACAICIWFTCVYHVCVCVYSCVSCLCVCAVHNIVEKVSGRCRPRRIRKPLAGKRANRERQHQVGAPDQDPGCGSRRPSELAPRSNPGHDLSIDRPPPSSSFSATQSEKSTTEGNRLIS